MSQKIFPAMFHANDSEGGIAHPWSPAFRRRAAAWFNKSPEPTAVGTGRSAIAVNVASRRWLSIFRSTKNLSFYPMPAYEETQKGNPYQLTVNQHCFPRACIARFCDRTGTVAVRTLPDGVYRRAKPEAKIFCAKRTWDQKAESGYMLKIEQDYHTLAERITASGCLSLSSNDSDIVSAMYCLWSLRIVFRDSPLVDQPLDGVQAVSMQLSKDDIEKLEKAGISSVRPDFTLPGRQIAGDLLQIKLNRELRNLRETNWRIKQSSSEEFIVPDRSLDKMILPLSPTLCFYHEAERDIYDEVFDVPEMNRLTITGSVDYYFARNLV